MYHGHILGVRAGDSIDCRQLADTKGRDQRGDAFDSSISVRRITCDGELDLRSDLLRSKSYQHSIRLHHQPT